MPTTYIIVLYSFLLVELEMVTNNLISARGAGKYLLIFCVGLLDILD
jgi:hypothetical protein